MALTSSGAGRYWTTASRSVWTPLFLKAEPQKAGTMSPARVLARMPARISSSVRLPVSRYFSVSASLASAAASSSLSRAASASARQASGMGASVKVSPWSWSFQRMACMATRSMTPSKLSSAPMGVCMQTGLAPNRSCIWPMTRWKSAPALSILLTKASLGTWYLLAWRQTVSDCGSTPEAPQKTTRAPSSTRRERSTSMVKSTWPGVSMMLMRCSSNCWAMPRQKVVVAAEVMVMPRSCSCSIQSMTAAPSCTSPILWETPV